MCESNPDDHPVVRRARCVVVCQLIFESMLAFLSLLTLLDGGWYGLLAGFAAITGTATMLARGCGNELMSLQIAIMLNTVATCFSIFQMGAPSKLAGCRPACDSRARARLPAQARP